MLFEEFDYITEEEDYETERGKPMPSKNHSRLERRLGVVLTPYEDRFDIMPELSLELLAGKATPDICLYPKLTFDWLDDEIRVTSPPITAIEILSPKQSLDDIKDKIFDVLFASGVQSAWVVVPTFQTIHVLTPDRQVRTFAGGLPLTDPATGVVVLLSEVFR